MGRDGLLAAGDTALASMREGRGGLLLLSGDAGIGKSSLAQAIAERAQRGSATVRVGACWEAEGLPPYTPWLGALSRPAEPAFDAVTERLARGDDAATDAASATRARARLFVEVVDALHDVSATRHQLIVLEDLHWADGPSLELLAAVAPRLRSMGVLVVATYRGDEMPRPNPLGALGGAAERITVDGLDADAVAQIVAAVTGRPRDDDAASELRERTGGNPLFVTELARLQDAGSHGVPTGVHDVLERRLARVSSGCAEVLGAAAVLGHEFDRRPLAALLDRDPDAALEEARAARLVEPREDDPRRYRFAHALVQATRYDGLSAGEREVLHRRAVDALIDAPGTTAASLAHHAVRARFDPDDPTPARLLTAAGGEALTALAWADAISAFERALALAPSADEGDPVRAEAWLGIGAARLRTDRSDVRDAFEAAAGFARRLDRPDLLARAALGFSVGLGAFEVRLLDRAQIELLEEAAESLEPSDPLLAVVLARLSVALAFTGADELRAQLALRAVELARAADDTVVLGHALAARCDAFAGPTHIRQRLAASEEIIDLGVREGDVPLELVGRRLRVVALFEELRFPEIDLEVGRFERAADRLGDPLYAWYVPLWRAARAFARGELTEARRLADEAVGVGAGGGSDNSELLGIVFGFMTACEIRDRDTAVDRFDAMLRQIPETLVEFFSMSRGYLEARAGDVDRARAAMRHVAAYGLDAIPYDSEWLPVLCQLTVGAAVAGDRELTAAARTALAPFAGIGAVEGIGAYCHGAVDRYLAMAASVEGDVAATRRHVDAALRCVEGGGSLLEALTALDAAWSLQQAGEPDERIRQLATRARREFDRLALDALAEEAAALGGAGSTALASAPVSTPELATPTLLREGDAWAVTWEGTTVRVKHAKGVADLAVLLERPDRDVHVRELEGVAATSSAGSTQPVLDEAAVHHYRQRLLDLEDDLDEATRHDDRGRAGLLAVERDALVDELTKAYGLGGQGRRLGSDPDERLRKAVSARVKTSIDRLEGLHPSLGRHLRASVRTGFFCRYTPERPIEWTIGR